MNGEMQTRPKRVVGLKYERDEGLPRVIVKGHGALAEQMLDRRGRTGPPVVEDEELLEQLYRLPVDAEIGPELFQLVAALLVHVYAIEGRLEEMRR